MDFAAAAIFSWYFFYQGNLDQSTCKKEKCILMTAVQLCDGCLTRRNALRLALRSRDHHWLNMKIDQGPFSFSIAAPHLRGFLSHVRTLMFKVIGFVVMKLLCVWVWVSALPPCEDCLTSHSLVAAMSDVANIQSDPKASKCTDVLVSTTSSAKRRHCCCFFYKNCQLQIPVTQWLKITDYFS